MANGNGADKALSPVEEAAIALYEAWLRPDVSAEEYDDRWRALVEAVRKTPRDE